MKISFLTGNQKKYEEVKQVLADFGIEVEQIDIDKPEIDSDSILEIAVHAAEKMANELGKPIVVEDTGVFFNAYNNFPGPQSKFVIHAIGFEGLFRLLDVADKSGSFKTVAAFCRPGEKAKTFEGVVNGRWVTDVEVKLTKMPYDYIFIPEGYEEVWINTPIVKHKISHRAKAFKKLADYLLEVENGQRLHILQDIKR